MLKVNTILKGDCMEVLKQLPDGCIDCIITSPPYWALRDYGVKNQIGLEEHPNEYIDKIINVMRECKRVLKPKGTIWLNLGDSYYTKSGSGQGSNYLKKHKQLDGGRGKLYQAHTQTRGKFKTKWLKQKQRLLIPYRVAIRCQDELGLILRNDLTWVKQYVNWKTKDSTGCSMPTSVQDRLNTNSETIFFFVKSHKYYFNLNAIRVPHKESTIKRAAYSFKKKSEGDKHYAIKSEGSNKFAENLLNGKLKGKNPGDCIMFPFEPSKENHFAMFPKTLPEFCIKAGCPKNGIVLDPFAGGGTTLYVAKHLKRKYIGVELNRKYIKIIKKRLTQEIFR